MTPAPTSRPAPASDRRRRWALVGAVAGAAALVVVAVAVGRSDTKASPAAGAPDAASSAASPGGLHAEVACDFAGKAEEAASAPELDERTRYAVAVLLLDQAIIESARAAELDPGLEVLDTALTAAHTAGHASDHDGWARAVDTARDECLAFTSGGA